VRTPEHVEEIPRPAPKPRMFPAAQKENLNEPGLTGLLPVAREETQEAATPSVVNHYTNCSFGPTNTKSAEGWKHRMKAPVFDDSKLDIESYMANFNAMTTEWTSDEKLALLREKLVGRAAKVLASLDLRGEPVTFEDVVSELERHYVGERSEWVAKLRDVKREHGETLDDLAFRISLYSKRAYGGLQPDLGLQFYLALRDGPLGDKLFECKDLSLPEVLQRAKSYEVHLLAVNQPVYSRQELSNSVGVAAISPDESRVNVPPQFRGQSGARSRGRGQGHGRGRGGGQRYDGSDRRLQQFERTCFICHSPEHFWRECPVGADHFSTIGPASRQDESGKPVGRASPKATVGHGRNINAKPDLGPTRSFLTTYLNGLPTCFLIDSGSESTFVSSRVYFRIPKDYRPPLIKSKDVITMADGESRLKILGNVMMPVRVHGTCFNFDMTVVDMESMDGIWGMDFLARFKCDFKMSTQTLVFNGTEYPMTTMKHDLLPHSVKLAQQIKIPSGTEMVIPAHLNRPFRSHQDITFEPSVFFVHKIGVLPAKSFTAQSRRRKCTPVQLFNPHEDDIIIPKGTIVGYAFPATLGDDLAPQPSTCATKKDNSPAVADDELLEDLEDAIPPHLDELFEKSSYGLTVQQRITLASVLIEFKDSFSTSPTDIGRTDLVSHTIDTGDIKPFRVPLRRHGFQKQEQIRAAVKDGLSRGIMEQSSSPWASAPVIVAKKDGTSRFCIDFRKINYVTKVDSYPLPRFDDCIDSLHGSKYFCSLDLQAGYWQVPLKTKEDRERTAFLTRDGLFQFTVLPFGLCNAEICSGKSVCYILTIY
jgi:hypothetical protein